jgi:hypothetical protein
MDSFFSLLMILAMLTVLASLGIGLFAMAKGSPAFSNKMMRWRVALQALAILFFVLAVTSKQ